MKLTKKLEAEILKVYQAFWDSYLSGDVKTMGSFLSDDFNLIGTSDGEVFNNKKSAMKYLKATIHQVAGVLSKKNSEIKITQINDTILVSEYFDAYINLDGTTSFYNKFRATSLMKSIRGKWKIVHQHGSLPDSKAEVGETLATDKVKKENLELREAVKRRTRELEQKNRDLEIEASLEKVRARAMAMQSTSELADLIGMIYSELTKLDVTLDRCFIMLFDEPSGDSTWWMASGDNPSLKRGYHLPFHKNSPHLPYLKAWRKKVSTWKYVLKGLEKRRMDEFMFTQTELEKLPKVDIKTMKALKRVCASAAFNKYGCITTGTLEPLVPTSFDLLVRFSRMFEQTYTRFLDLKKAEAQTRESQIQLALERVRARTMAMQHSEELQDASNLLFRQVQSLDIPVWSCGFNIWEKREKICTGWMSTNDVIQPPFKIPLTESPTFIRFDKSRKKNEDFYVEKVEGKVLAAHYKYMLSLPDFARIIEKRLRTGFKLPKSQINHVANFAHGNLVFITGEPVPDAWDIFKRFAKVFEQTYTRFLDLKKAEAQAREAQVEAALERVRSRTMAMHKSDELREVVGVLYDQIKQLGFAKGVANIGLMDRDSGDVQWWMSGFGLDEFPDSYLVKYFNHPAVDEMLERWKKGDKFASIQLTGASKRKFDQSFIFKSDFSRAPEEIKRQMASVKKVVFSLAYMKYGALNLGPEAITGEQAEILQRFAIVFEQTYTRFLDLKKAEAQAREAQIEAALEKVRSASMGMHHSYELEKVVAVLFDKLSELGLSFDAALLFVFDKSKRNIQVWLDAKHLPAPINIILPYDEEFAKNPVIEDLRRGEDIINKSYSGQAKDDYFRYTVRHNESKIPENDRKLFFELSAWTVSFAAEKNSIIAVDSWYGQTTTIENFQILKRFARVFEQAYVRFLDLQNAEAQARESQIQLALERVRARTMAMHVSSDLAQISAILFDQLKQLGVSMWVSGFSICREDSAVVEKWMTRPDGKIMDTLCIPYTEDSDEALCYELWKNGVELHAVVVGAEEIRQGHEHYRNTPSMKIIVERLEELGLELPHWGKIHTATFKHGYLSIVTTAPFEETQIFVRFAKVFEQTYTRFLDLKNAEALARESQIQLALERVRARTMAMQKSHELADVAEVLFQQVRDLGY